MNVQHRYTILCLFLLSFFHVNAQEVPFEKGVNLTNWFQSSSAQEIHLTRYTKTDFEDIQSLGCDVIRLPINLHHMTGGAPDYTLDTLFLRFLDTAVSWANQLDMHLILDNHTFDPSVDTDPQVGAILEKVWTQMATHYKSSSAKIYYEILNEPHGISDAAWNSIQQEVVSAIREIDTTHTIIIGPAGWNSFQNLEEMPEYEQEKLIYTFHFYEPFLFTHQGASWSEPSMEPLAGVPFPYDADSMPPLPNALEDSWVEYSYNDYPQEGTASHVKNLIDIAVDFSETRDVPVFCGEFGVYKPNSNPNDRVNWYEVVAGYLDQHNIPWTMWDYHGGFGVFEAGTNGLFDYHLNIPLLEAVGFHTPEQEEFVLKPDSTGFVLYSDYIGPDIFEASYSQGPVNYYATDSPNNGDFCLSWHDAEQYNQIGFDFVPDRDLSALRDSGYVLDFMMRINSSENLAPNVRFIDTKTGPGEHPWRMGYTIDAETVPSDSRWHHVHIPLQDFTERGSWDNDTWYEPQGLFDWAAVDRFEIVAEHQDFENVWVWVDNLHVTNQDTALVRDTTTFTLPDSITGLRKAQGQAEITVYPNPAKNVIRISGKRATKAELYTLTGTLLRSYHHTRRLNISWLQPGVYLLKIRRNGVVQTQRLVKQ